MLKGGGGTGGFDTGVGSEVGHEVRGMSGPQIDAATLRRRWWRRLRMRGAVSWDSAGLE